MNVLLKILYTAIVVAGTVYVATAVFQFFGVGIETYGVYLMFFVAVAMLYAFLPAETGMLFSPK